MGMQRDYSTYVITNPCIDLKDATCLEVCPVDCIESDPSEPQYFINPELCIVCEQCVLVCPVDAIMLEHEVPLEWKDSIERNAAFFRKAAAALPVVSDHDARNVVAGAVVRANELGVSVTIAIVDRQGTQIALETVGSPSDDTETAALNRAYSAGVLERSTADLNERLIGGAPDDADRSRLVAEAGGIPIGRPYVIAGIGIAGGTPEQNHECARAALAPR